MRKALLLLLLALAPASVPAQQPAEDPLARYLYSPELVLDHQQAINLSEPARLTIQEAMLEAQTKFLGLKFVMARETENLRNLLRTGRIDEAAILKQIDQLLGVEREMKRTQLSLMIKIKNTLTPEQQAALDRLREPRPEEAGDGSRGPVIMLDGRRMPAGYDLRQLARENIETIEVVKGEVAARLYGPESRAGVIVVTTRKR